MPRHRREVSRVEGFSDAVFAFAITLLVVSLEVPKSFHELMATMRGFLSFAICFALLFQVWWRQYRFFRAFDLEDATVIALTGGMLFVVLFYVYPLNFLWSVSFASFEGRRIDETVITPAQMPALFVIYGAGVVAIFSILALLYRHAYRLRNQLSLTAEDALEARMQMYSNLGIALIGAASISIALLCQAMAPNSVGIAGLIYFAIGIVEWRLAVYRRRQRN